SFNLDGTNIYMTLASLFIAQAMGYDLTFGQQLTILLVALLTSKGASGISGAGFITLAATLATVNPALVPGMAILLGIDKFMSEDAKPDPASPQGGTTLHQIVIVGGGAAGLQLATKLGDKLGRRGKVAVTLVDRARTHIWKPLLHEVAAGSMNVGHHAVDYLA